MIKSCFKHLILNNVQIGKSSEQKVSKFDIFQAKAYKNVKTLALESNKIV